MDADSASTVLVVEDELTVREGLEELLAAEGYSVALAADGAEALAKAAELVPDLILLDVMTPDMDGFEVCRRLRADLHLAEVPVIMVTSLADRDSCLQGFEAGADEFVTKPFDQVELLARVKTATRLNRYRRLLEEQERRRKTEEGLQKSEERYHSLFAHVPTGLYRSTPEGQVLDANPALLQVIGFSGEDELADVNTAAWYVDPEERERFLDLMEREGVVHGFEVQLRRRDGAVIWAKIDARAVRNADGQVLCYEGSLEDITGRKQDEEALQRRNRELALLNRASQALGSTLDLDHVLAAVLEEVRNLLGVVASSVWLMDRETRELVCRQTTGPQSDIVRGWRLVPGEGLAGWAARSGESLIVPDILADERHSRRVDQETGLDLRSVLSVPLRVKEKVIGVLQVVDAEVGRFDEADLELLEPLAAAAAIAIENARLYEETDRLRAFSESMVQSLEEGILLEDAFGQFAFVNPKAAALLGYTADELVGRRWTHILAPGHQTDVEEGYTGQPGGPTVRYESVLLTKGGRRMPVIVSARSLYQEGRFIGVLSAFTDITARKRAEEELRRRNEELTALNAVASAVGQLLSLEEMLDAALRETLAVLDAEGGLLCLLDRATQTFLPAVHRGLSSTLLQEVTGFRIGEGLSGQAAQAGQPLFVSDLTGGAGYISATAVEEGWRSLASVPLKAKDAVVGVMTAVSRAEGRFSAESASLLTAIGHQLGVAIENARLIEEAAEVEVLHELDRLRSELIANVSHELRTPLGLIKVFCSTLLADDVEFDDETQQECLHSIDEEADRLAGIVDNLLDLSRIESERLAMDMQPTDIGQLAREVIGDMEAQAPRHRFVHDFPDYPLMAVADGRRIEQVLRNLLSNAVKYAPDGGTITVRGLGDERQLLIGVSDEGIGIPGQDLERVFERFYRVENEVTQRVGGAGLGLAVCRGIVEAHGGRIWAESTPGEGSTFHFTLMGQKHDVQD